MDTYNFTLWVDHADEFKGKPGIQVRRIATSGTQYNLRCSSKDKAALEAFKTEVGAGHRPLTVT